MNLSDVEVHPCEMMDAYDLALMALHKQIIAGQYDLVPHLQGEVLKIRNKIAEKLHEHSWLSVPEDQRI